MCVSNFVNFPKCANAENIFQILKQRRLSRYPLNLCVFVYTRTSDDPEDQALAPKFLSTAADISCSEGDQVGIS